MEKRHCFWAPGKSFESNLGGFFREIKGASEKKNPAICGGGVAGEKWPREARQTVLPINSPKRINKKILAGQVGFGWCLSNEASGKKSFLGSHLQTILVFLRDFLVKKA